MRERPLEALLEEARSLSWSRFGRRLILHLPGMFYLEGRRGRYPAVSITSSHCRLGCDHCRGRILEGMPQVHSAKELVQRCLHWAEQGAAGVLITGASDSNGRLPWDGFLEAIARIKQCSSLHVSVHSGIVDQRTARALGEAGVDQVLVDVVGDQATAHQVLHLPGGVGAIRRSLLHLRDAGLRIVPHICIGMHYGQVLGERKALDLLEDIGPSRIVWIVLMPMLGTPMEGTSPPPLDEIGRLIAESRMRFPDAEVSLGCARPRGKVRAAIEEVAIDAGVNRMALYSQRALDRARSYGLEIVYRETCCSVDLLGCPELQTPGTRNSEP